MARKWFGGYVNAVIGTPVLTSTARDELPDKIAGFKSGRDDYLTKPFALAELEVRLDALIRRSKGRRQILEVGDLRFDLATHEVTRNGARLQMYAGCKKLLAELLRASPAVVTRERLESVLWGDDPPDGDMLRSHIYELRKTVDAPFAMKLIQTVPKVGYRIAAPDGKMKRPLGLRQRLICGILGYVVLLSSAVVVHGYLVNERAERLVWESTLELG